MISLRKGVVTGKENALRSGESDLEGEELLGESIGVAAWDEPEIDSNDERVISMYDGVRKILSGQSETNESRARTNQRKPRPRKGVSTPRDAGHTLQCGRILKVDVEPRLVIITVEKLDGERRQLRIEARLD